MVILDIQDATSPADTAAAITAAGLAERAAVLEKGKPLPTLRELIDAGTNLLVFAEVGGPGAPPWYQRHVRLVPGDAVHLPERRCLRLRAQPGTTAAPLLLVNHWVSEKGLANPAAASKANRKDELESRLERCLRERGRMPNIIAVDFAGRGDLVATADEINSRLVELIDGLSGPTGTEPVAATTVADGATTTAAAPEVASGPALTTGPITALTGGDPAAFCAVLADARIVLYGWTLALATEPADEAGQADLAFAPTLVRRLPAYLSSAPTELKARAQPVLDRARAALQVLRDAGVDDAGITALADQAERRLSEVTGLDSVTAVPDLEAAVASATGADRFPGLASGFAAAHPQTADLLDLGDVPEAVAAAAGFDCLSAPAGLIDLTQDTTAPGG